MWIKKKNGYPGEYVDNRSLAYKQVMHGKKSITAAFDPTYQLFHRAYYYDGYVL